VILDENPTYKIQIKNNVIWLYYSTKKRFIELQVGAPFCIPEQAWEFLKSGQHYISHGHTELNL